MSHSVLRAAASRRLLQEQLIVKYLSLQEVWVYNLSGCTESQPTQRQTLQQRRTRLREQPQLQHSPRILPKCCPVSGQLWHHHPMSGQIWYVTVQWVASCDMSLSASSQLWHVTVQWLWCVTVQWVVRYDMSLSNEWSIVTCLVSGQI